MKPRRPRTDLACLDSPSILGLLKGLPKTSRPWPKAQRDRWLTAFQAVLEMEYSEGDAEKEEATT